MKRRKTERNGRERSRNERRRCCWKGMEKNWMVEGRSSRLKDGGRKQGKSEENRREKRERIEEPIEVGRMTKEERKGKHRGWKSNRMDGESRMEENRTRGERERGK